MTSRAFLAGLAVLGASILLLGPGSQAPVSRADGNSDDSEAQDGDESQGEAGPPAGAGEQQRDAWLGARIEALIAERAHLGNARIGIYVRDLDSGRVVFEKNATERFSVASNAKIVTAAAALARLGPGFRYRTTALAEELDAQGVIKGDLFLRGTGDPYLGNRDLANLADDLALAGVRQVRGGLIVDDSYFDDQVLPPHFDEQPDEQAAFRPPVSALGLDFGAFAVVVRPALSGRGPAAVSIDPPNDYIRITKNTLVTQQSGRNRVLLAAKPADAHIEVEVGGQIRAGSPMWRYRLRVEDPVLHTGAVFRALLARRGIRVRGKTERGVAPAAARDLAHVDSEPLNLLVHGMSKYSNNYMAEALLKTVGAETLAKDPQGTPRPATWQDGLLAVKGFLRDEVGLEGPFRYGNGSGLFDATAISPVQLVQVLSAARRNPDYGPDLVASLAIAGVDGTLRRRMRDTPARGRVRAKTGTLATASALSGYAAVDESRPLVFAIVVNEIPDTYRARRQARSLQDRVADALIVYLNSATGARD